MLHVEWAGESGDVVEESCAIFGRTRLANQTLEFSSRVGRRQPLTFEVSLISVGVGDVMSVWTK
jgi:hypothetical protein